MNRLMNDPVLKQLAELDPAPVRPLTRTQELRADALLHRIMTGPRRPARAPRQASRIGRRAAAAGLTVLAAIGATVFATMPASAERVLLEAAENAARQPAVTSEYWYVRSQVKDPQTIPYQREIWRSKERSVLRDEQSAAFRAAQEGKEALDPELVRVEEITNQDGVVPPFGDGVSVTWEQLERLPTDPVRLKQWLTDNLPESGHGKDWALWEATASLLQESPASPELRRALWEVAASIPGIELLGKTTDSASRTVTAVEADFSDQGLERFVLMLNPGDGTLLETRIFDADGTLLYRATVLEWGPQNTAPELEEPLCGTATSSHASC
ncbi:hypothetical protein DNL40_08945 [Xylanimonas oleitrophica]|uniref:Uncharacterized protein n=1 Tax=Xylanimonas oleitrophica TaxID=2607479 RepID=A0A2W5WPM9_9MICO|nr:CU044_5270 family protein [Xylanimonas oleitrophica]PZR53120.1 hypothetical protein DNL40_08945 [Xylanimonas oleitrophica]